MNDTTDNEEKLGVHKAAQEASPPKPAHTAHPWDNHAGWAKQPHLSGKTMLIIGVVLLSLLSGLFGSWLTVQSGLVGGSQIVNTKQSTTVQESSALTAVAKNVSPSVVSITTEGTTQGQSSFGGFGTVVQGAGSGIILSKDGYILTNKHVVPDGTTSVTVVLADGTTYKNVSIIGRDPANDLAFLKISGVSNLPFATIGDSSTVVVGQQVVAIGNALGQYQNSVTSGIISGIGRPVQASDETGASTENLDNLFQTDAAINPGNSGGPLLNLEGQVIGIDTAVAQDAQGIGFAIPIDDAKGLINTVLSTGKVQRGMLGVRYIDINAQTAEQYSLSVQSGAYLIGDQSNPAIVSGSAGDKAGLKEKDIITAVDGVSLTQGRSLVGVLGGYKPGDTVTLSVLRGSQKLTLKATLGS